MELKLLIADDEITSAKRIERKIDLKKYDITEIRYAEDGQFALNICEDWHPDILISDIVMPRVNGIDLANKLKDDNDNLQIIFISGYSDKKYLKNAIRLNAINYVEKPIDMDELDEAIATARENIENISKTRDAISSLENERLQKMQEQIARSISSRHYTKESFDHVVGDYMAFEEGFKSCCAVTISFLPHKDGTTVSLDSQKAVIASVADSMSISCCITIRGDMLVCVVFSPIHDDYITNFCDELLREFTRQHCHFYIGVGRPVDTLYGLHDSYLEAVNASAISFFHEPDYISYYHINNQTYDLSTHNPVELIHEIYNVSKDQMIFTVRTIASSIMQCEATPIVDVKDFFFNMAAELLRRSKVDGVSLWPQFKSEFDLSDYIMSSAFLIHILNFLIDGIKEYYNYIESDYYDNSTVNWIVRYIRSNYSDPNLSTDTFIEHLNLSNTYICHLFKDVTGQNLKNYITEFRMKKAIDLIKNPNLQLSDIAIAVGYRNGNYFSSRFKEYFGCTPSEYKESKNR